MQLSVIISTRNRARQLASALSSVITQSLPQHFYEVIVVDNGSTDETQQIVSEFSATHGNIVCAFQAVPGLHNCRHLGMRVAKSDYLVFTDDDIQASPSWLESLYSSFADHRAVVATGNILPIYADNPPKWVDYLWTRNEWGMVLGHFSLLDFGIHQKEVPADFVWGCNFAIQKELLLDVGGFHPDAMPYELRRFRGDGETHVSHELNSRGITALFHPQALIHHCIGSERLTMDYLYERSFLQGISNSFSETRYGCMNGKEYSMTAQRKDEKTLLGRLGQRARMLIPCDNATKIRRRLIQAAADGYAFHQGELEHDSVLRAWLTRNTYLDCCCPGYNSNQAPAVELKG
jgi:glycosyltransferase involved in cell wall biosynthesis